MRTALFSVCFVGVTAVSLPLLAQVSPGAVAPPSVGDKAPSAGGTMEEKTAPAPAGDAAEEQADPFSLEQEPKASPEEKPPEEVVEEQKPGAGENPLAKPRVIALSPEEKTALPYEPPPDPNTLPFTYHQKHIDLAAGFRLASATHKGLDLFSESNVLPEFVVRAGGAFLSVDRFSLAVLAEMGLSGTDASLRSSFTNLELTRFTLGIEGRYHMHHRLFGYARVAPGVELATAFLNRGYESEMKDKSAAFQFDAALGMALRLAGNSDGSRRVPRFWAFVEGGFRVAGAHEMELEYPDGAGPARPVPLALSPFATTGGLGTAGLMVTF